MKTFLKNTINAVYNDFSTKNSDFAAIVIKCIIIAMLIFISIYIEFFVLIALVLALIFVATQNNGRSIYYLLFLLPLMHIFRRNVSDIYFVAYILCVVIAVLGIKLLIDLIKKRKKVNWFFTVMTVLLCVYILIFANYSNLSFLASLLLGITIFFLAQYYKEDLNFKELALIFIYGMIVSVVIGLFRGTSDRLQHFIWGFSAYNLERFAGAYLNANILAGEAMLALSLIYTLDLNRSIKIITYPLIAILTITLIFTLSKTGFIIFLVITILYIIIYLIKNFDKNTIWKLLSIIILLSLLFLIFSTVTAVLSDRFTSTVKTSTTIDNVTGEMIVDNDINLSELTTGRLDIWKTYLKTILNSKKHLFFGFGVGEAFIGEFGSYTNFPPHNTLLQMVYYIGVIGSLIFLILLFSQFKKKDYRRIKWYNTIPIIAISLYLFAADFFSYRLFIYLIIVLMALFFTVTEKNNEIVKNISKTNKMPKVIHYIWLGGNPLPKIAEKCMISWKKLCPDYEIKRWDESNVNLDICPYCRDAYDAKKYAFASDVLRFDIINREGGIYLDIDVEIVKNIDKFLEHNMFFGFEDDKNINPGVIFGSCTNNKILNELLDEYKVKKFIFNDKNQETICHITTNKLSKYGLISNNTFQDLGVFTVYPTEYFSPKGIADGVIRKTNNTHSIHHFAATWYSKKQKLKLFIKKVLNFFTNGYLGKLYNKLKRGKDEKQ